MLLDILACEFTWERHVKGTNCVYMAFVYTLYLFVDKPLS